MNESLKVTLVGASGPVAKEFLSLWGESGPQVERFRGWDVVPHVGALFDFQGQPQIIGEIDPSDLSEGEWVILALDRDSSLAATACVVTCSNITSSSAWPWNMSLPVSM